MKRQEIAALLFWDHTDKAGDDLLCLEIATLNWSISWLFVALVYHQGMVKILVATCQVYKNVVGMMAIVKDLPLAWMQ